MDLQDVTKNQHFVPQVEQRLNAINPSAKEENQKIYSFSVVDRERYSFKLESNKGSKISKTLSLHDLFSFDVLKEQAARYNFERLFHKYESSIKCNTESLLSKLSVANSDIKSEILDLFIAKFLNFIRNPYSIKKVLNTFPMLRNLRPTDKVHAENFKRVLEGRKPQQDYLCKQLDISIEEYTDWLSIMFLILTPLEDEQPNFLEEVVKDMYENPDAFIMVLIYTYDTETCLLSDRGYSIPLTDSDHMAWDFNLSSVGFIRYIFANIDLVAPSNAPLELVEEYKSRPKVVHVHRMVNDMDALERYNQHVAYQCFNNVYNSKPECYGLITSI